MLLELLFSAFAVYGSAAAYKGGKKLFGGRNTNLGGFQGRDGKYEFNGVKYDTLEEMSKAEAELIKKNIEEEQEWFRKNIEEPRAKEIAEEYRKSTLAKK